MSKEQVNQKLDKMQENRTTHYRTLTPKSDFDLLVLDQLCMQTIVRYPNVLHSTTKLTIQRSSFYSQRRAPSPARMAGIRFTVTLLLLKNPRTCKMLSRVLWVSNLVVTQNVRCVPKNVRQVPKNVMWVPKNFKWVPKNVRWVSPLPQPSPPLHHCRAAPLADL